MFGEAGRPGVGTHYDFSRLSDAEYTALSAASEKIKAGGFGALADGEFFTMKELVSKCIVTRI
jgi:hypothetical protein